MQDLNAHQPSLELELEKESILLDPKRIENSVLKRLIMEVQIDKIEITPNAYNRTHNRHNRGR
jgi:hypothetical protein